MYLTQNQVRCGLYSNTRYYKCTIDRGILLTLTKVFTLQFGYLGIPFFQDVYLTIH